MYQYDKQKLRNMYNDYLEQSQSTVKDLCRQFDKKKNAYVVKKTTQKKSGSLDMRKLSKYRTSENIFKKGSVRPGDISHSVDVLVDWSSSVRPMLLDMVKQAITLARFCRQSKIEFSINAFSSVPRARFKLSNGDSSRKDLDSDLSNLTMLQFMNSEQSKNQFETSAYVFFCLAACENNRNAFNLDMEIRNKYALHATPLNQALVQIKGMIDERDVQNKNLVVITDGMGGDLKPKLNYHMINTKTTHIDPKSNKSYKMGECLDDSVPDIGDIRINNKYRQTNLLLKWIEDSGISTIGMFLYKKDYDFKYFLRAAYYMQTGTLAKLNKNAKVIPGLHFLNNFAGYEDMYFIDTKKIFNSKEANLEFEENDKKNAKKVAKKMAEASFSSRGRKFVAQTVADKICSSYDI